MEVTMIDYSFTTPICKELTQSNSLQNVYHKQNSIIEKSTNIDNKR